MHKHVYKNKRDQAAQGKEASNHDSFVMAGEAPRTTVAEEVF